jgi:hypothetical protein
MKQGVPGRTHEACSAIPFVLLMSYLSDTYLFIYLQNAVEIALLFNYMPADSKYDIFE